MGSDSNGDDNETLATPLAVAVATFVKTQNTLLVSFVVEHEDNRRLRHDVDARDRWERGGTLLA